MKTSLISPPDHLSQTSKELWGHLAGNRITSPEQLALLQVALETLDRLNQVRQILAKGDLAATSKKTGTMRINPLINAEAKLREQFIELWWRLGLQNERY